MPLSDKKCCVPDCNKGQKRTILHTFPNPDKEPDRFRTWLYAISGDVLALDNQTIFKYRKVCHTHFESRYYTCSNRLSANAIPTLHLAGFSVRREPLQDISNNMANVQVPQPMNPSTSKAIIVENADFAGAGTSGFKFIPKSSLKDQPRCRSGNSSEISILSQQVKKLTQTKDRYAIRLKKALKLSENIAFQAALKKFTSLAVIFTMMQFREAKKNKMGRRFTKDEKIMALSLYKQGPKAYRWLRKIFVLPSPVTLSRVISMAALKPGINENIFVQLQKQVRKMNDMEKLCVLLFDEMAIAPHFDYNKKKDTIIGFVNNGKKPKKEIANHVLVFMIRGVYKNYKQPLSYTFCSASTKKQELAVQVVEIIQKLKSIGFKVLATICDQGTSNVSAIKYLVNQTKVEYLKRHKEFRHNTFEVDGEEVIPLYDPPHLIKGIRNNLLKKDLKCTINNCEKTAKWNHIIQLYNENPSYKGIRLLPKLTENHVIPNKILKMKVKCATQVFSRSVAINMGYLADKGILDQECKQTADVMLFFDNLFDSVNGNYHSHKKTSKPLLKPLTPNSRHRKVWLEARKIFDSMKFVSKEGNTRVVPSVTNWIWTLDNLEYLNEKLFQEHNLKSIWQRHFNQDPLENFFGCVRSHGARNTNPTCAGFEVAFAALLINNLTSSHSPGSNCEVDKCYKFKTLKKIFFSKNQTSTEAPTEIDFDDISHHILVGVENKIRNPKIKAQIEYVAGYVLRKTKLKVFKGCEFCEKSLFNQNEDNVSIIIKEHVANKRHLTYPATQLVASFSDIQDVVTHVIKRDCTKINIKNYIKTALSVLCDFNYLNCRKHKKEVIEYIQDISCNFFLYNWCRDTNKLLKGSRSDYDNEDEVQAMSFKYYEIRRKKEIILTTFFFIPKPTC